MIAVKVSDRIIASCFLLIEMLVFSRPTVEVIVSDRFFSAINQYVWRILRSDILDLSQSESGIHVNQGITFIELSKWPRVAKILVADGTEWRLFICGRLGVINLMGILHMN